MPNKSSSYAKKAKFSAFEVANFGISIDPSYTGKDITDVKKASQHSKRKLKIFNY